MTATAGNYGLCKCGCGRSTSIADRNHTNRGWIKGEPIPFIKGHGGRRKEHILTEVDELNRRAVCVMCGATSIAKNGSRWRCCKRIITEHRLVDRSQDGSTAHCLGCMSKVPTVKRGGRSLCSIADSQRNQEYRQKNTDKIREKGVEYRKSNPTYFKNKHLVRTYGMTYEDYEVMLAAQGGACRICRSPDGDRSLAVDHCHKTNVIRGLLCNRCNTTLGKVEEDIGLLEAMISYLKAPI